MLRLRMPYDERALPKSPFSPALPSGQVAPCGGRARWSGGKVSPGADLPRADARVDQRA
jgi:hypothetical protein